MVSPADIEAAHQRIAPYIRETPVIALEPGALGVPTALLLKLESLQHTGSFKPRGAFNRLLTSDVPASGVIAASGGNHGIAAWFAGRITIIGVEPEGSSAFAAALRAGELVDVSVRSIAADSLGARRVGALMFALTRQYRVNCLLVSDVAIQEAQRRLWQELRVVAELGGATALAALTSGVYQPAPGERVGVLICGGNTDPGTVG